MPSFKKLLGAIGDPHPLVYLALYVAAIPLYALLYNGMDRQFYQSTSPFDETFLTHRDAVERQLQRVLSRWVMMRSAPKYDIRPETITVYDLELKGDDVQFQLGWQAHVQLSHCDTPCSDEFASTRWLLMLSPPSIDDVEIYGELDFTVEDVPNAFVARLPKPDTPFWMHWAPDMRGRIEKVGANIDFADAALSGLLYPEMSLRRSLERFRQAAKGLTIPARGGYRRFLYFSTITITTVGYGDVVPLTDAARLAAASEALAGVLLLGLFLNSLGNRVARKKPTEAA